MINKTKKQFEFRNCFFFAYSSLFSCLIWFILFLYFCIGIALLLREVFFLVFLVFLWFLFNTIWNLSWVICVIFFSGRIGCFYTFIFILNLRIGPCLLWSVCFSIQKHFHLNFPRYQAFTCRISFFTNIYPKIE